MGGTEGSWRGMALALVNAPAQQVGWRGAGIARVEAGCAGKGERWRACARKGSGKMMGPIGSLFFSGVKP